MPDAPSSSTTDALMAAAPDLAGLTIPAEARTAVRANIEMALANARRMGDVGDDAAPVFRA